MASFAGGRIRIYCGPPSCGAPDDLLEAIVDFIDGAKDSLAIAVQELESKPIARAIVRAAQRKVRIRMVLEQDYLRAGEPASDPFDLSEAVEDEENRALLAALLRAGVDVRADYNPAIFHQKFIVRDPGERTRGVLSGSTNFTWTGVGVLNDSPAHKGNLNHVVIIEDGWLTREFETEFNELWDGTFGKTRHRHDAAPRNCVVGPSHARVRVRAIFAPDHTPELEIMKQILKSRERIDFAIFTFAQSSGIDDAFIRAADARVKVRGVFDRAQGNQAWAATKLIAEAGADAPADRKPEAYIIKKRSDIAPPNNRVGKLHHKLMTLDDQVAIAGSFNYTAPANRLNDENILILGDLHEDDPGSRAEQGRIAEYFRTEIDRIITDLAEPV